MLSPADRYQRDLHAQSLQADPAQAQIVEHLQQVYERLLVRYRQNQSGWRRLVRRFGRPVQPERGLYIWGGVGRGKTHLMDLFFDSLPFDTKLRVHFHRFMQRVHERLTALSGERNPLDQVARELSEEAWVLCFDEFFVSDIGDAMILAGLVEGLFRRGVTLVATSNIPPNMLYQDGLQRARFLPVIDLIQQNMSVLHLDSATDYRFRTLERVELLHTPIDDVSHAKLESTFLALTGGSEASTEQLEVNHRPVSVIRRAPGVLWCSFASLCLEPRSASDYVELAREYHTVMIEAIPSLDGDKEDAARRFINLVDEFYDRNVKLIASAAAEPAELYQGVRLRFEFERTASRLQEMRTREYLQAAHRP